MSILVTGGAGFIGSNFLNTLINSCDDEIICLDSLTYASNLNNVPKEVTKIKYLKFSLYINQNMFFILPQKVM